MWEQQYDILLYTPLGKKHGLLSVCKKDNEIDGTLTLLAHKRIFRGSIDETGNCEIAGSITTLLHTIPYTAVGRITPASVCLQMKANRSQYELIGKACEKKEAQII